MRALVKAGYNPRVAHQYVAHTINTHHSAKKLTPTHTNADKKRKNHSAIILALVLIAAISYGAYLYLPNLSNQALNDKAENIETGAGKVADNADDLALLNSALIEHDARICENIIDSAIKEQCSGSFAAKNETTCDEKCQDEKLLNDAFIKRDAGLCSNIKDNATRENCFNYFNADKKEVECKGYCKDMNLLNSAIIQGDVNLCMQINDSSVKAQCDQIFKKEVDENDDESDQT